MPERRCLNGDNEVLNNDVKGDSPRINRAVQAALSLNFPNFGEAQASANRRRNSPEVLPQSGPGGARYFGEKELHGIAHAILKEHKFENFVESEEGGDPRFVLTLPMALPRNGPSAGRDALFAAPP